MEEGKGQVKILALEELETEERRKERMSSIEALKEDGIHTPESNAQSALMSYLLQLGGVRDEVYQYLLTPRFKDTSLVAAIRPLLCAAAPVGWIRLAVDAQEKKSSQIFVNEIVAAYKERIPLETAAEFLKESGTPFEICQRRLNYKEEMGMERKERKGAAEEGEVYLKESRMSRSEEEQVLRMENEKLKEENIRLKAELHDRMTQSKDQKLHDRMTQSKDQKLHDRMTQSKDQKLHDRMTQSRGPEPYDRITQSGEAEPCDRMTQSCGPESYNRMTQSEDLKLHDRMTQSEEAELHDRMAQSRGPELYDRMTQSRGPELYDRMTQSEDLKLHDRMTQSREPEPYENVSRSAERDSSSFHMEQIPDFPNGTEILDHKMLVMDLEQKELESGKRTSFFTVLLARHMKKAFAKLDSDTQISRIFEIMVGKKYGKAKILAIRRMMNGGMANEFIYSLLEEDRSEQELVELSHVLLDEDLEGTADMRALKPEGAAEIETKQESMESLQKPDERGSGFRKYEEETFV